MGRRSVSPAAPLAPSGSGAVFPGAAMTRPPLARVPRGQADAALAGARLEGMVPGMKISSHVCTCLVAHATHLAGSMRCSMARGAGP